MSVTVSFRIPKELKEKMKRLRSRVNWSEEVRRFLEERVRELEQLEAIKELEDSVKALTQVPRGTALKYLREDRDSH